MTARQEILRALGGITEDNRPTPERQEKSQFSIRDNIWRTRTIAERLYGAERINQEEYDAAQRFAVTFVLTYDGPGAVQSAASTSIIKHDKISWALQMAKEAGNVRDVKEFVGADVYNLLVLSLYDCYSAEAIAGMLAASTVRKTATGAIDTLCAQSYRKLAKFYRLPKVNKITRKKTPPSVL